MDGADPQFLLWLGETPDGGLTPVEFTVDLDRDRQGNFYFAKAARHALPAMVKHHGVILKLDPDGKNLETVSRVAFTSKAVEARLLPSENDDKTHVWIEVNPRADI